jgi:thioredoxin-related protein
MNANRTPSRRIWPALCLVALFATRLGAAEVEWRTDYAKALAEATEKGRPLLMDMGTDNCYWCKQLDLRTFIDPELIKLLNERCVPLKVDGSKNDYLVKALRIQAYPTLVFAGPDGSILGYKEGFIEAGPLKEHLLKVLATVGTPDWMTRDHEAAVKALAAGDSARALTLLRNVVEDGKSRQVQVKARQLIADVERRAAEQAAKAKELAEQGKTEEATVAIDKLGRDYPGTLAVQQGKQVLMSLASKAEGQKDQRRKQAREMLEQAQEDYKSQRFFICLDRCEMLTGEFPDLDEAREASALAEKIKDNPEWTRKACDQLGERLGVLYLSLADSWMRKGQPQQAIFYLERVTKLFPGTRQAETAQVRLARLRGSPGSAGDARK